MKRITDVILDRDGTVIVDKHYLHDPAGVELLPGAGEALARLSKAGIRLFIATNQSGIGRGYFKEEDYLAVHERLVDVLAEYGVAVAGAAHCPHAPETVCSCRKPQTGMWISLAEAHGLDPATAVMIGDKIADVGLGLAAGMAASVLVLTGKGEKDAAKLELPGFDGPHMEPSPRGGKQPHLVARDLAAAADWILANNEVAR